MINSLTLHTISMLSVTMFIIRMTLKINHFAEEDAEIRTSISTHSIQRKSDFKNKKPSSQTSVTIIVTFTLLIPYLLHAICAFQVHWIVCSQLILFLAFMKRDIYRELMLSKQFDDEIFWILNRVIVEMKTGKSFRRSFAEAAIRSPKKFSRIVDVLIDFVSFSPQVLPSFYRQSEKLDSFCRILSQACSLQSHTLVILEAHRDHLKMIRYFRRKSGQVTAQLKLQFVIILSLYGFALWHFLRTDASKRYLSLFWFSVALLSLGICSMVALGRKSKWKT